jgi:hypothetical protein
MLSMMNHIFSAQKKKIDFGGRGFESGCVKKILKKKRLIEFLDNRERLGALESEKLDNSSSTIIFFFFF